MTVFPLPIVSLKDLLYDPSPIFAMLTQDPEDDSSVAISALRVYQIHGTSLEAAASHPKSIVH